MDKQKRIAFFHEDDYCQWEILPLTAKGFCMKQMGEIDDFAEEHQLAGGVYTDMFVREDSPHGIEELSLCPEQLNEALGFLPAYDQVETGYSSYREELKLTYGRGMEEEQNVFWSVDEAGVINALWLDIWIAPKSKDLWKSILIALGKMASVLLADWGWQRCVDLTNLSDVEQYIKEKSSL